MIAAIRTLPGSRHEIQATLAAAEAPSPSERRSEALATLGCPTTAAAAADARKFEEDAGTSCAPLSPTKKHRKHHTMAEDEEREGNSRPNLVDTLFQRAPGKRKVKLNYEFLQSNEVPAEVEDEDDDFTDRDEEDGEDDGSDASSIEGEEEDETDEDEEGSEDEEEDDSEDEVMHEETESLEENGMPLLRAFDKTSPSSKAGEAPDLSREGTTQDLFLPKGPYLFPANTVCTLCLNLKHKSEEVIQCDKCGIAVHEACYGPFDFHDDDASQTSSTSTEPWFCEPCLYGLMEPPHCALCPNRFGAFKRAEGGNWVHLNCALWTAGVAFVDNHHMTAVSWREVDSKEFGKRTCALCPEKIEARTGMTTQCDAAMCKQYFHISCAQKHGMLFDHSETSGEGTSSHAVDPRIVACKKHATQEEIKTQRRAYMRMHAEEERRMVNYRRKILNARETRKKENQKRIHMDNWKSLNIKYNKHPGPRYLHQHPEFIHGMQEKMEHHIEGGAEQFKKGFSQVNRIDKMFYLTPGFSSEFVRYFEHRQKNVIPKAKADAAALQQKIEEMKAKQDSLLEDAERLQAQNEEVKKGVDEVDRKMQSIYTLMTNLGVKKITPVANMPSSPKKRGRPRGRSASGSQLKSPATALKQAPRLNTCHECHKSHDQHLLALCDVCKKYYHLACLDPPLAAMPKKTRLAGWMCSSCADSSGSDKEPDLSGGNIATSRTRRRQAASIFTPTPAPKRGRRT
ncbi:hypothetical protein L596_028622 [Steinernema carpocapsae]|uniref:PHD-type domain-containing protein n=1 Tax=Steinernema carpocapsae TaxID=34508 RepID=A0A4U5LZ23_STECR|nr:hypothetical protein L596_028622 [Steinernema carpocapsae]